MSWTTFFNYVADRLAEKSTYQGLVALLTAAGVVLSPGRITEITAAGTAIVAIIHIVTPSTA